MAASMVAEAYVPQVSALVQGGYGPPQWPPAHQNGQVCRPGTLFDPAGFGVGPVSRDVALAGLGGLPHLPGAVYGDAISQPCILVGGAWEERSDHYGLGGSLVCYGAGARMPFAAPGEQDPFDLMLDTAMTLEGWTKVSERPASGGDKGHSSRTYRRGHREWAEIQFLWPPGTYGTVFDPPGTFIHTSLVRDDADRFEGTVGYWVAPYACDGAIVCGPQQPLHVM